VPPARRRGSRGAGPLGCLFWLVVLGAAVYAGIRLAAPHVQAWRFEDAMQVQAEAAEIRSDSEIRAALMDTAADLGLGLEPRNLRIRRTRSGITIAADWSAEVVLPKYRRMLHFHRQVSAPVGSQPP
jgi:hypothetical protein